MPEKTEKRTALDVIRTAYKNPANDHLRLAVNAEENAIGSWNSTQGRFVIVACLTITDEWCEMPYELIVNGERIPQTWTEISRGTQTEGGEKHHA